MTLDIDSRVWSYLLEHRQTANAANVAAHCGISEEEAQSYFDRIGSENWRHSASCASLTRLLLTDPPKPAACDCKPQHVPTRAHNVGESNYAKHTIQPWDIWLEYRLNPWDADIVKRVLRSKPGQRRLDYEKIKHICEERIRQIDEGLDDVSVERKAGATA